MENKISRSLAFAMYTVLHKKLLGKSEYTWINASIYKPGKWQMLVDHYRLKLSGWKGRPRTSSVMAVSPNGNRKFFEVKIPGQFTEDYYRQLRNLDAVAMSTIFNALCKLSDEGHSIVYLESEICKKKEVIEFIKPYEGSSLLIEADLLAPDFAYLDRPTDFCTLLSELTNT